MADNVSESSTYIDDRPVYFRVFTRESLATIKQRMEEELILKSEQLQKPEVISTSSFLTITENIL